MELSKLTAVELRKVATQTYAIKGAAKHSKAVLLEMCEAIEAERAAAAEAAHAERIAYGAAPEPWPTTEAAKPTAKKGTARAGMRMHVSSHASGADKAEQIKAQVLALAPTAECTVDASKKGVTLTVRLADTTIRLAWAVAGSYAYDRTALTRPDRKPIRLRNASAALKTVAALAARAATQPVAPVTKARMRKAA